VAFAFGTTRERASKILKEGLADGPELEPRLSRGENHCRAILTDDEVRAVRADPRRYREIAESYDITAVYVSVLKRGLCRSEAGGPIIPLKVRPMLTPRDKIAIKADPRPLEEIAETYNVTPAHIRRIQREGVPVKPQLTLRDEVAIKADTRPTKEIAESYNVSPGHINRIKRDGGRLARRKKRVLTPPSLSTTSGPKRK
jgi:hypothetical protein